MKGNSIIRVAWAGLALAGAACSKPANVAVSTGIQVSGAPAIRLAPSRPPRQIGASFGGSRSVVTRPTDRQADRPVVSREDSPKQAESTLAASSADPGLKDRLLLEAAMNGQPKTVAYLISRGARAGEPAIVEAAAQSRSVPTLKAVLDGGGNLRDVRGDGYKLIHLAALSDSPDMIRYLAKRGVSVDERSTQNRETPLYVAAINGKAASVKTLLDLGASKTLPNVENELPADAARYHGHSELTAMLAPVQHKTLWQH